jgi:hypothetical protein
MFAYRYAAVVSTVTGSGILKNGDDERAIAGFTSAAANTRPPRTDDG